MDHKHESANLILKLYELRREEVMRQARKWFIGFNPESLEDFQKVFADMQTSAYYRMVTTYWDMAASLVNNGAIDEQMFNDANLEHAAIFSKLHPFIDQLRTSSNMPNYLRHLEQVVMRLPDAEARLQGMRERFKAMSAIRREAEQAQTAASAAVAAAD